MAQGAMFYSFSPTAGLLGGVQFRFVDLSQTEF